MTQKKDNAKRTDWKDVFGSGPDGLRALVQQVIQEVLEAEMDETVGAHKSERSADRVGYRAGYYTRTLVTRVGKLVLPRNPFRCSGSNWRDRLSQPSREP